MPNAPWAPLNPSLQPADPCSAPCTTPAPSCSDRGARPPALARVALPPRPWHGQPDQTAWTCQRAPNAALLQFLPAGLLQRSRSAPSQTVVAPMARAGLSPRVALPSGPWPVLRLCTAWACRRMPIATRVQSRPSLLPASPRSTACITRGPSCAERGAGPSALGLRCHRAHGTANWTKLVGHANGYLHQPRSSFLALNSTHGGALLPLEDRRGADGPGRLEP